MTYICSCSGGKDSVATIILAHEKGYPLDEIIFSEVMFDENISGELPEHIEFINNVLKPQCEERGYKFTIVRANKTYMDCFNHIVLKSKETSRIGKRVGFPMQGKCVINRDCKVRPILRYTKSLRENIQYVGIAVDEPKRLERLTDVREFINSVKLKYKQKHRFDKAPTAKCYCVDCCYHDNETGRCCKFDLYTEDDWFCCDGEPRKTEVKKKCLKDL